MIDNKISGICLINEVSEPNEVKIIGGKSDKPIIEARLMTADMKNRNGRRYIYDDIRTQVNSPRSRELIETRTWMGEAGHPITSDLNRQNTIDPKCASHLILDMWMNGKDVMGKICGLDNEHGKLFSSLVKEGSKVAFSLRALGIVNPTSEGNLVKSPKFITFDWVVYPSFPNAYQTKVLSESAGLELTNDKYTNKFIIESAKYDGTVAINCNREMLDYIKESTTSIDDVIKRYGINSRTAKITLDGRYLTFDDADKNKFKMLIESNINNDIMDYFGQL